MQTKNGQIKRIHSKFQQLKILDTDYKPSPKTQPQFPLSPQSSPIQLRPPHKNTLKKQEQSTTPKSQLPHSQGQLIYTQSQISKEVAKLKPYLAIKNDIMTSQQLEQKRNKEISQQNYKMMSQLAILENRKLCQVVDLEREEQVEQITEREEKEKEGWIFQVFYRSSQSLRDDLGRKPFLCGYAVMTEIVEIYESLTFQKQVLTIIPSSITMVRYGEQTNYEVITIEQGNIKIQIGFLNQRKFELFDRMLFLQKAMSRSTSSRLFQNQLIKSIYAQYQKGA